VRGKAKEVYGFDHIPGGISRCRATRVGRRREVCFVWRVLHIEGALKSPVSCPLLLMSGQAMAFSSD
jgi:hypothetical protein